MKNIALKRIIALILMISFISLTGCGNNVTNEDATLTEEESIIAENYTDTTENIKKTETVYANLNPDGSARAITVSDWLHADKSKIKINDTTTLKNFAVTKGHASAVENNGSITWQMASSDVYYEGSVKQELPVEINIRYFLDNKEMSAEEIAGKNGKIKMEISMKNKIKKEVEIDGKKITMYAPFVVIGGMMLDYDTFSEIEVTNGLSIGSGTYEMVILATAPGINESLGLNSINISGFENYSFSDTFTITATTENFNLSDTYYMIAPLSSLNLNIDMPDTLKDVQNILNELNNLETLLNNIDTDGQLMQFISDNKKVKEAIDILKEGLTVYSENKAMLNAISEYLTPENIKAISDFLNTLDSEQMQQLTSVLSNVPALQSMIDSLLQLSSGVSDIMPILEGLSKALEDPEVAASLENLPETMETINKLADFMNENEEVLDILTQLLTSEDFDKFTGTLNSVITENGENISNIDVSNLSNDGKELIKRMSEWINIDYPIFTSAPDYMDTSCTFICKTDPIK